MKKVLFLCLGLLTSSTYATLPEHVSELFYCSGGSNGYNVLFNLDSTMVVMDLETQTQFSGSYKIENGKVSLSVPDVGFAESSLQVEEMRDLIITMSFPSLNCHAVGHEQGPAVEAYVKCPSIKYIPGVSYEKNAFEFFGHRMVKRRRWTEVPNDTWYKESYGVYFLDGDSVTMVFGDRQEERVLTGKIVNQNSLLINELEPERGACESQ